MDAKIYDDSSIDDMFPKSKPEDLSIEELRDQGYVHEAEELERKLFEESRLEAELERRNKTLYSMLGLERAYLSTLPKTTLFKMYAGVKHHTPQLKILQELTPPQIVEYFVGTFYFLTNQNFKKRVLEKSETKNHNFISSLVGLAAEEMNTRKKGKPRERLEKKDIGQKTRGNPFRFESTHGKKSSTIYKRTQKFSDQIKLEKYFLSSKKYIEPMTKRIYLALNGSDDIKIYQEDFKNPRLKSKISKKGNPYLISRQDKTFSQLYANIIADKLIEKYGLKKEHRPKR